MGPGKLLDFHIATDVQHAKQFMHNYTTCFQKYIFIYKLYEFATHKYKFKMLARSDCSIKWFRFLQKRNDSAYKVFNKPIK